MPNPMNLHRWSDTPVEKMNDLVTRQVIHGDQMTLARLELKAGAFVPRHSHPNEQISMVAEGSLRFELGEQEVVVRAGEMLRIPGDVPHSALALEDSVAVDLFSPVREDWVRGDDAYLRGR